MNIEDISIQDLKKLRPDLYAMISEETKESLKKDPKKASAHKELSEQEPAEAKFGDVIRWIPTGEEGIVVGFDSFGKGKQKVIIELYDGTKIKLDNKALSYEILSNKEKRVFISKRESYKKASKKWDNSSQTPNVFKPNYHERVIKKTKPTNNAPTARMAKKRTISKPISETVRATLELAKQGYTFEAIAWKRRLSGLTISKHLSELIQIGHLDVFDYVDRIVYNEISNVVQKLPKGATLNQVKNRCPQGTKRNIIRLVMADLNKMG